ncbi:MAG TPA: hypothetical protein VNX67_06220 [Solirubrobacteraceae bacterium]|jgi:hypothetical protein|nr:hypothetical protein [Solirubrobacteraceae bacterium]
MRARPHTNARLRSPANTAARCVLLLACLTLAALASAGSAAAANYRFGLSDYEPKTFSDPRVAELGVHLARDVVPWNVALNKRDLANVTVWLNAVKHAYHIIPFITFQHADDNGRAPTPGQFLNAFRRFRKLFPWVKEFAPWDEATHSTQPTAHNPWLASSYYNVLAANCNGCEITAPDILDSDGNVEAWVAAFLEKAHPYPKIWPYNPYHSISVGSTALIESFLAVVRGQVWFSEVGGVVWWRFKGRLINHGEAYAARVDHNIFSFAKLSSRITRVYYYHWRSPGGPKAKAARRATWDAGLVKANGAPRAALYVVAKELGRHFQRSIPKLF